MAFPTIPTVAAGRLLTGFDTAPATATFPSLSSLTKNAGDLLIAICAVYQSTAAAGAVFSGWGGGFTEFVDQRGGTTQMSIGAAYKWSTGSETGPFDVTIGATITGHAALILMSIPGAHATTPPEGGTIAVGTTAAADPPALDPAGWAAEDTLWIAVGGSGETSLTGSYTGMGLAAGPPTNYGNAVSTGESGDVIGAVAAAVAFRQLNATSEDIGPWSSVDLSNARNVALAIAVRPAPSATQSGVRRVSLASLSTPETRTAHKLRIRARKQSGTGTVTIRAAVYEGATNRSGDLETGPVTTSLADYDLLIPDANAANITDYSNLEYRWWGYSSTGDAVVVEVSPQDSWLDVPAAAAGTDWTATPSDTMAIADAVAISRGLAVADTMALADSVAANRGLSAVVDDTMAIRDGNDYNAIIDPDSPAGHYKLEEASGATLVARVGPNGVFSGSITYRAAALVEDGGAAVSFNRPSGTAGGYAEIAQAAAEAAFDTTGRFSYECWVTPQSDTARSSNQNLLSRHFFGIYLTAANVPAIFFGAGGASTATAADALVAGVKYHLEFSFDGTTLKVLANGTTVISVAGSATLGGPLGIAEYPGGIDTANVTMDEVAVYVEALPDARAKFHLYGGGDVLIEQAAPLAQQVDDTIAATDSVSTSATFARSIGDTAGLADLLAFARLLGLADTGGLADSVAAGLARSAVVNDTAALADAINLARGRALDLADTAALADVLVSAAAFARQVDDTAGLADAVQLARGVLLTDTASLTDVLSTVSVIVRALAEALQITDAVETAGTGAISRTVSDTLAIVEQLATQATFARQINDTAALADSVRRDVALALAEALSVTDQTNAVVGVLRAIADTAALSDQATPQVTGQDLTRTIADTLGITDATVRSTGYSVLVEDAASVADQLDAVLGIIVELADSLGLTDDVVAGRGLALIVDDVLVITDAVTTQRLVGGPFRALVVQLSAVKVVTARLDEHQLVDVLVEARRAGTVHLEEV